MTTKKTLAARKARADRRERAWSMLASGATDEMVVAADIGYRDVGAMRADLRKWRGTRVARAADDWFDRQMVVLERLLADTAIYDKGKASYEEKVARGALVVRILERMARMTGTDAPRKVAVAGALVTLSMEEAARMSTADLAYVAENGRLPVTSTEKSPLRLVSNGSKSPPGEGSKPKSPLGEGTSDGE